MLARLSFLTLALSLAACQPAKPPVAPTPSPEVAADRAWPSPPLTATSDAHDDPLRVLELP